MVRWIQYIPIAGLACKLAPAFERMAWAADYAIGADLSFFMFAPDNNWYNFSDLIKAGIHGIEESLEGAPSPRIMLHIDRGGDLPATIYFFNKLREYGVDYDVIGQSYDPWWHDSLLDLKENLDFMAKEYGKEIILVDVAYHWKENREYGSTPTPFTQTPEGQREFLKYVHRLVLATPKGLAREYSGGSRQFLCCREFPAEGLSIWKGMPYRLLTSLINTPAVAQTEPTDRAG